VATVALTRHFAHTKRLVHRDVKATNILIDAAVKPYVSVLGLALIEDFGTVPGFAETPAYVIPSRPEERQTESMVAPTSSASR
jgi:serine/threonine protein kinase